MVAAVNVCMQHIMLVDMNPTICNRYETISDTVVGILQRGKKKFGVVHFPGEMLFQGQSDNVIIKLTDKAASFKA